MERILLKCAYNRLYKVSGTITYVFDNHFHSIIKKVTLAAKFDGFHGELIFDWH